MENDVWAEVPFDRESFHFHFGHPFKRLWLGRDWIIEPGGEYRPAACHLAPTDRGFLSSIEATSVPNQVLIRKLFVFKWLQRFCWASPWTGGKELSIMVSVLRE